MESNINFSKAYKKFLRLLATNTASCIAIFTLLSIAFSVGKAYESNHSQKKLNVLTLERIKENKEFNEEIYKLRKEITTLEESEKYFKIKFEEVVEKLEKYEK